MVGDNRLPLAEYDDRDEAEIQISMYQQLEWLRYELKRKPGWTAITFREMFGDWPGRWMKDLTPMEASSELRKFVRRRDAKFRREKKREDAGGALPGGRAAAQEANGVSGGDGTLGGGSWGSAMASPGNLKADG
jgi:hypothetical protein